MKLPVFDIKGKSLASWSVDEKSLGSVNEKLLAQAIRIYESNAHQKTSKVKTRGEVIGSTKKIYRQKGTGNARHGARYAPIFVGGGVAHGPTGVRPQNLVLPKKMRAKALASSLLLKLQSSTVSGVESVEKTDGKSSTLATLLNTVAGHPNKRVLVVTEARADNLYRGLKNIQAVEMKRAAVVNAFDLIYFDHVVVTKDALDSLVARASLKKKDTSDKAQIAPVKAKPADGKTEEKKAAVVKTAAKKAAAKKGVTQAASTSSTAKRVTAKRGAK